MSGQALLQVDHLGIESVGRRVLEDICLEIVRGSATAKAVPEVRVSHPGAKVTHEAAIGSVDRRRLETLMARGLDPDTVYIRLTPDSGAEFSSLITGHDRCP